MARIAIVKVRGPQDMEWHTPKLVKRGLRLVRAEALQHLEKVAGQAFMPQLTLPYLAAIGEEYNKKNDRDHRFYVIDEPEERLKLMDYDLVFFTVNTSMAPATYRVSDRLRARGIPTILGGIHPTVLPEEAAQHATSLAVGEAETQMETILRDFEQGALKLRYSGGRNCSLERVPTPRWQDAIVEDYCPWVLPIQTSRGCRNACTFCSTTRYQGVRRRHRPVGDIVEEIKDLQERGILTPDKTIFFTDNNIVSDSDHRKGVRDTRYAKKLFKALIPLGINWVGQGEINVGEDTELVDLMARSGCFLLLIGLETISQENLSLLAKRSNQVTQYVDSIENLHRHGIGNIGCFITGLDEDSPEVFDDIGHFIDRYIDVPQVSILTPFPGTVLYKRMEKEGRLLHKDWSQYDITHVTFKPKNMSPEELEAGYLRLAERNFSTRKMLQRSIRYAARRTVNQMPRFGFREQVGAILATNIIYKRLAFMNRGIQHRAHSLHSCGEAKTRHFA